MMLTDRQTIDVLTLLEKIACIIRGFVNNTAPPTPLENRTFGAPFSPRNPRLYADGE